MLITAEVALTLEADGRSAKVPVFVQPDSEQPCLLGTNAIPELGIQLLRSNGEALFARPAAAPTESTVKSVSVHLVQSEAIPGKKGRFLDVCSTTQFQMGDNLMFQPNTRVLQVLGLSSSDSLVTARADGTVLVPFQNHKPEMVSIDSSVEIGTVEPLDEDAKISEDDDDKTPEMSGDVLVIAGSNNEDKKMQLKKMLNIPRSDLTADQVSQLEEVLLDAEDAFSLDDNDLGHTSLVQHRIETGDSTPVKQPPRRVPLAQREKVSKMIDDMIAAGSDSAFYKCMG